MKKEDYKTVAWSIEFEGSISIIKSKRKVQIQGFNLIPTISLYNTDHELITNFQKMVGCGRIDKRLRRKEQHSNEYIWRLVNSKKIILLVDKILPYAPTKKFKRKCEIIREYCISKGGIRIHKQYDKNEINLFKKIKSLNMKGKNE